jgi:hypothetical protein
LEFVLGGALRCERVVSHKVFAFVWSFVSRNAIAVERWAKDQRLHTLQIGGGFDSALPSDPFGENQGVVALGLVPHSCRGGAGYKKWDSDREAVDALRFSMRFYRVREFHTE